MAWAKRPQKLRSGSGLGSVRTNGRRKRSIFPPTKPSRHGSRVVAARIITATPMAAARPRVWTSGIGTSSRPSRAMQTVSPAKSAALPADARAMPTASSVS